MTPAAKQAREALEHYADDDCYPMYKNYPYGQNKNCVSASMARKAIEALDAEGDGTEGVWLDPAFIGALTNVMKDLKRKPLPAHIGEFSFSELNRTYEAVLATPAKPSASTEKEADRQDAITNADAARAAAWDAWVAYCAACSAYDAVNKEPKP